MQRNASRQVSMGLQPRTTPVTRNGTKPEWTLTLNREWTRIGAMPPPMFYSRLARISSEHLGRRPAPAWNVGAGTWLLRWLNRIRNQSHRAPAKPKAGPRLDGGCLSQNLIKMSKTSHGTAALTAAPGTRGVEYRTWGGGNQGHLSSCMVFAGNYFLTIICRVIFSDNYRYFVVEF